MSISTDFTQKMPVFNRLTEQYSTLRQMHSHHSTCSPRSRQAESYPLDLNESCCKAPEALPRLAACQTCHHHGGKAQPWEEALGPGPSCAPTCTVILGDSHGFLFFCSSLQCFVCTVLWTAPKMMGPQARLAAGGAAATKTITASKHWFDLLDCFFCFLTF